MSKTIKNYLKKHKNVLTLYMDVPTRDEAKLHAACNEFCPHHVAHYLGMDVHDTGTHHLYCSN